LECDKCHKARATMHFTSIENGKSREAHLCPSCAPGGDFGTPFGLGISLGKILGPLLDMPAKAKIVAKKNIKKCPSCGTTWAMIEEQHRLGCPNDYEIFAEELEVVLREHHRSTRHVGKRPGMDPEVRKAENAAAVKAEAEREAKEAKETKHKKLLEELDQVVKTENYEKAAEIRDHIKAMEEERKKEQAP